MKGKIGRKLTLRRSQRGDTLISVSMSVAAISLVIVLSYFLVSRGISLNQQAKEREQVRNLVQSQIEGIKNLAFKAGTDPTQNPFYTYSKGDTSLTDAYELRFFCLNADGLIVTYEHAVNATPAPAPAIVAKKDTTTKELIFNNTSLYKDWKDVDDDLHTIGDSNDPEAGKLECEKFDILDATNLEIVITYEKYKDVPGPPPDKVEQNLFTVTATWEGAHGGREEDMVVATRLHPLSSSSP